MKKRGTDMSKRFPLDVVMELTRKQADDAAAVLAQLRAKERAASETLQMLENCRHEYQARFERTSQSGIGNEQWRNYQEFLAKLDQAISQQREVLGKCSVSCQAGLQEWQLARIKLKSFDVLFERHQRGEAQRESRSEQRDQDERSAASHQRARKPS
ncbi:MAG TPA: flagellar export protein FliJ [Burkholderiales bacterium]|nr:flagellar export protein FliJ [Burkholderiales bacterium]